MCLKLSASDNISMDGKNLALLLAENCLRAQLPNSDYASLIKKRLSSSYRNFCFFPIIIVLLLKYWNYRDCKF